MVNIINIIFRKAQKSVDFVYRLNNLKLNDNVIVKTSKGLLFGKILSIKASRSFCAKIKGLIIRKAETKDIEIFKEIKKFEEKAFKIIKIKAKKYNENMKIVDVECTFDKVKMIVYFSSEERIDFRILFNELIKIFKLWIEFEKVNIRKSAEINGGIGICGKIFCCCTFLKNIKKISIKSAINQEILLSSNKLCGVCGKLFCCLKYEEDNYKENLKILPKINEIINTPKGMAVVLSREILTKKIKVMFLGSLDSSTETFNFNEITKL